MSDEHYDSKLMIFEDRRKQNPLEKDVSEMKLKIEGICDDINDLSISVQNYVEHAAGLQNSMLRNQDKMQEALQRQLDQNNDQHKEIISLFRNEMIKREESLESRMNLILVAQEKEDKEQNKKIDELKSDVKILKETPLKRGADNWRRVSDIVLAMIATAVISGIIYYTTIVIKMPFIQPKVEGVINK